MKSFVGRDEKTILTLFAAAISQAISLCAHNGLDFDFPMLFRRYVINGLPVPAILNRINKKPWDPGLEDTMAMWSSSQWKYRCSLDLLAHVFGLPSPKEGMTGADVATVFYGMFEDGPADELPMDKEDRALNKIASYCSGDVVTMVDVYARMRGVESYTDIKILKHNNEPEPQEPQA